MHDDKCVKKEDSKGETIVQEAAVDESDSQAYPGCLVTAVKAPLLHCLISSRRLHRRSMNATLITSASSGLE